MKYSANDKIAGEKSRLTTNECNENKLFVRWIISIAFNIIWWIITLTPTVAESLTTVIPIPYSLFRYAISILLFIIVFIVSSIIPVPAIRLSVGLRSSQFILYLVFIIGLLLLLGLYINELLEHPGADALREVLFWHQLPVWLICVLSVGLFIAFSQLLLRPQVNSGKHAFIVFAILLAAFVGYGQYAPGLYVTNSQLAHLDAYYTSAYNVLHGTPLDQSTTSIYGHYGIILGLIMKLSAALGAVNMWKVFCLLMAICAAIVSLSCSYSIFVMTKSSTVRYLASIAAVCMNMWFCRYWQLMPHRQIPLAVTMIIIAYFVQHPEKIKRYLPAAFVLEALCLLWSTDYGLASAIGFASFLFFAKTTKSNKKHIALAALEAVASVVIIVLLAVGFTDIYNAVNGGALLSPLEFLGATADMGNGGFIERLVMAVPGRLSAWMGMTALAFLIIGYVLTRPRNTSNASAFMFAVATMSLGGMSYYMNRASFGHHEGHYFLSFVLLAIVADRCIDADFTHIRLFGRQQSDMKRGVLLPLKNGMGVLSFFVLFVLALATVTNIGAAQLLWKDFRDPESSYVMAANVKAVIPPNTPAWGYGMNEVYSVLGWDTQFHATDFADVTINKKSKAHFEEQLHTLSDKDAVTTTYSLQVLKNRDEHLYASFMETHVLQESIPIQYTRPSQSTDCIEYYKAIR